MFDSDIKRETISSHCGAYNHYPRTELVSVCDIDIDRVLSCKKQWNVDSHYINYQEMLENENIDILSICTHPDSHEDIVHVAVKNGVKAIFCEKPISNNLRSAKKIVNLCNNYKVVLAVNHSRRWDEYFIRLKNDISNDIFGKLQHINFYYTRGIANSGSHLFDLLRFLFGEVININAINSIDEIENDLTLSCTLELENGLLCNLIGLDGRYYRIFNLEIFGSNSKILIDTSKQVSFFKSSPSKRSSEFSELYDAPYPTKTIQNKQIFISSLSNIIDCIENNSVVQCTGVDGYKSLELITAAKLSYEIQKKIFLPLSEKWHE